MCHRFFRLLCGLGKCYLHLFHCMLSHMLLNTIKCCSNTYSRCMLYAYRCRSSGSTDVGVDVCLQHVCCDVWLENSDTEDEKAHKNWKKSIMLVYRSAATHKYALSSVFMFSSQQLSYTSVLLLCMYRVCQKSTSKRIWLIF